MRLIERSTPIAWCEHALSNTAVLLLDHLHCEMKAASVALSLVSKNPQMEALVAPLLTLAEEELAHYRQLHALLARRAVRAEPIAPNHYMQQLRRRVGSRGVDPLLDRLLVAALIEARSCERFQLLAAATETAGDAELAQTFRELMTSEARHIRVYADVAKEIFGGDFVERRLPAVAAMESAILDELPPGPLLHSGWRGL